MTRCFDSYTQACEFEDMMRDRYETTIVRINDSWMVICER